MSWLFILRIAFEKWAEMEQKSAGYRPVSVSYLSRALGLRLNTIRDHVVHENFRLALRFPHCNLLGYIGGPKEEIAYREAIQYINKPTKRQENE